jgi:hypothetical protein
VAFLRCGFNQSIARESAPKLEVGAKARIVTREGDEISVATAAYRIDQFGQQASSQCLVARIQLNVRVLPHYQAIEIRRAFTQRHCGERVNRLYQRQALGLGPLRAKLVLICLKMCTVRAKRRPKRREWAIERTRAKRRTSVMETPNAASTQPRRQRARTARLMKGSRQPEE